MEEVTSPRVLRVTLSRYGLAPRKRLGQNFLIDANLRDKMIACAAPRPGELVVEIGPGPGALTAKLAATGAQVLAIEIDQGLARVLVDRLPPEPGRLVVVVGDIRRLDLVDTVAGAGLSGRPCLAVASLPYYLTTPLLFHLFEADLPWRCMVFLVQREVATRIVAPPSSKGYGQLSVMVQYRSRAEIVAIVPPTVFWPPPKVQSALIRLAFPGRSRLAPREEQALFGLVKAAFGQRRKTLANACRVWAVGQAPGGGFNAACRRAEIDPGHRAEELSVEEFIRLAVEIAAERER